MALYWVDLLDQAVLEDMSCLLFMTSGSPHTTQYLSPLHELRKVINSISTSLRPLTIHPQELLRAQQ